MIFPSESDLTSFAEHLGASLRTQPLPLCLELVGDVGAGKTTFTRALARGLGITEPVTSPSFTISKHYSAKNARLIHYDFYRLSDPGLMQDDLSEALDAKDAIIVLEWAQSVASILPKDHITITFHILPDGSRDLIIKGLKK